MKKQKIQMILILVVLVLCIGAYFLVSHMAKQEEQKQKDSETEGQTTIAEIDAEVDAFFFFFNGKTYSYTKDGEDWKYDDDNSLQLDADSINTMLEKLNGVIALETLDSYDSLSDYGLDKPQNTISVTVGDKTTTFYIGDYNDMVSEYYLKMEGDDAVYLVDSTLNDTFSKTVDTLVKEEDTETEETTE